MSTLVVYSDTSDGYVDSFSGQAGYEDDGAYDGDYASARAGGSLAASTLPSAVLVGQKLDGGNILQFDDEVIGWADIYHVYESFLSFDTSSIPDGDTVSAAVLRVTSNGDVSTTDFDIQARLRDWGTTVTTADWVADLSGLTLLGSYATSSGFTADTGYDLSDTAMAANVNKTGSTRMLLCSSRTVGNNEPTGNEYVWIRAADYAGTTSDPKLTVTHAAGGSTLFLMLEDDSGAYELEDDSGGILLEPGA